MKRTQIQILLGACLVTIFAVSCATLPYQPYAREVKKRPGEGGVIALKTENRPEDRAKADQLMASACGQNAAVKILEEGEVQVGEKINSVANHEQKNERKEAFAIGGLKFMSAPQPTNSISTETEKVAVKEWQISYACVALTPEPALKKSSRKVSKNQSN